MINKIKVTVECFEDEKPIHTTSGSAKVDRDFSKTLVTLFGLAKENIIKEMLV